MACTTKKIINFWITTKNNKLVTTSFLFETIHKYRKEFKNKVLVIFLDNAKMHYSEEMKLLAEKLGVYLFFNAAYSSKINLVEYVFEKIKRRIRHRLSKQLRVNLKDMLFKETVNMMNSDFKIETKKFYDEIHNALMLKNMWTMNMKTPERKQFSDGINGV